MKILEVADRLNKLNNSSYNCDCPLSHGLNCSFLGGDYTQTLKTVLSERIPYGKCALVATEADYLRFAKTIQTAIKEIGGKFIGLVVTPPTADSVDATVELFNLPDDVRAVIVFGNELFNSVAYYASVKGVLLIAVPLTPNVAYALSTASLFANGTNTDRISLSAERVILLDEKIIDEDGIPDAYAFIMSKLTALADYRLYCAVYNVEPCKYAYDLAKKAVISAFGIIKVPPHLMALTLTEYSSYLGIANAVTGGALYDFSAATACSALYGKALNAELYYSVKLMGVYDLFLNNEYTLLAHTDYQARAKYFSENYPFPLLQTEKNLIAQVRTIRRGEKKLNSVIKALKTEMGANAAYAENILKVYYALGGVKPKLNAKKLKLAIKHGGEVPYYLNGLSIARAKGVLEFIY